jgi:cysteinyl-tRNA synthetase
MDARPAEAGVIFALPILIRISGHCLWRSVGMELKLYDTLARDKRVFSPIYPQRVRMYVCGPTVYDFAHIGNARPVIVFDVLFRLLRHIYGDDHVTYVRNITDVDDKINARAAERGIAIRELTEETYANYKADVAALGCLPPTVEPRATEYIRRDDGKLDMVTLIERLIANGNAYPAEGHVLFHVPSMPDYGKLSKRSLDEMIAGARVEVAPYKRNPMDFVLWKPSNSAEPGWDSPWGRGRPGWHIECSAMSGALLGEIFDIHGGGIDLVFPHHENEIAQSRCAFHTGVMANYWMHNGHLQVEGDKMSKSLGNFVTMRELLTVWPGSVLRFQMLKTHYRQPIDWTTASTEQAATALDTFRHVTQTADPAHGNISEAVLASLADDLNTPQAIVELHRLADEARKGVYQAASDLRATCDFLGIGLREANLQEISKRQHGNIDEGKIESLIAARTAARKTRNFAESDRIRDELAAMGVVLKDSKEGTTWEIAR